MSRLLRVVVAALSALFVVLLCFVPAGAASTPIGAGHGPISANVFGAGWQSNSDLTWNLASTEAGLSVLRSSPAADGVWNEVASLHIAGIASRQWIGHGCLIPHSHVVAVAFGPVEYIDTSQLFERGAFASLVNLDTGVVDGLSLRPSFSYFSPTCGAAGIATFTSYSNAEAQTQIHAVDAGGHRKAASVSNVAGELTDASVAADGAVIAVRGESVLRFAADARSTVLVSAPSAIYGVRLGQSGIVYEYDRRGQTKVLQHLNGEQDVLIAHGPQGGVSTGLLVDGSTIVQGSEAKLDHTGSGVVVRNVSAGSQASVRGSAFSTVEGVADPGRSTSISMTNGAGTAMHESLPSSVFASTPAQAVPDGSMRPHAATATSPTTTDPNLPCAVQRNDPKIEAYQPSVPQIEWAVDQAVNGRLTPARAANYRNWGLPAYTAQGLEPRPALIGGGAVPPQILLGILANESNLWQASSHVSPGGYGNPLTGNIYGRSGTALTIDFSNADCGYGISQVTDGMLGGQQSLNTQKAIALDYQVNIAAGLKILIGKWNQLASYTPKIQMNNGDPSWIENWYAAIWAYNTGLQPNADNGNSTGCTPGPSCTDSKGYWGLGWANNPANPIYPPDRHMFNVTPADAVTPSNWPYQERVIGWAALPIYEPGGSYSQAWWGTDGERDAAIPSPALFCTTADHCQASPDANGSGSCADVDLHCWVHFAVNWKNCATECGHSNTAYSSTSAEPADPITQDPSDCTNGLPAGSVIVDDLSPASSSPYACHSVTTVGSFAFAFGLDAHNNFPAHIDLHQINGGLNGHYWFTHTSQTTDPTVDATGTWTFPASTVGSGKVMVHVPALGGQTGQAKYTVIDGATGAQQSRILDQGWGSNHWISLGAFKFTANEKVALNDYAPHDDGEDVAWDAVAFVPASAPVYKVVSLGDSYSAGEGLQPYLPNADRPSDACHRSSQAYANLVTLPGQTTALGQNTADEFDFIACSGSHSTSITSDAVSASGQEIPYDSGWDAPRYEQGEELQTSQGYLDASTDAVTLSIGGNDARFSDVVSYCSVGPTLSNCSSNGQIMPHDTQPLNQYEPHVIRDLLPSKLLATYKRIHALAPNAVIFVLGYPHLFPENANDATTCGFVSTADANWLNSMGDLMATTIQSAVTQAAALGIKIHAIDPRSTFVGHDVCSSSSWINGIVATSTSGSGTKAPGTGSYHPKASGQVAYGKLLTSAIATWLPKK